MKGVTDHEMSEGETRYRFAGEVISRSGENSTVMRRAEITNAEGEESYWSIKASKLWLLPGSDWAVLNAVIKVGEIPILYLPAFYYPANEIIFHPVLGYRTREGTYVQTTTYILGRPRAVSSAEESSITSIMGSGEGMEQIREGVFLRSTGSRQRDINEPRLSLMADAYVNLGYFAGSELSLPSQGHFGDLLFTAGIGFSRDIVLASGYYTPFPNYDGTSNWHRSRLFDQSVPFRYRFVSTGSINGTGGTVNSADLFWSLPFYSDPFVDNDFMRRSEDSSFFSLLKGATTYDMTISDTSLDSYIWQLNGSLLFSTAGLEPYINDLSITSAAMALSFETRNTYPPPSHSNGIISYPPNLRFYFPDKFTLFSIAASIGGTPVFIGKRGEEGGGEEAEIDGLGKAMPPWKKNEEDTKSGSGDGDLLGLHPPVLTRALQAPILGGNRFTLDYRINPAAASEIKFNSNRPGAPWEKPEDINWGDIEYQLYSVRLDGNMGLTLAQKEDIYTHSLRFYGTSSWQNYAYMNDSVTDQNSTMTQTRNMTFFSSSAEYGFTLRPFFQNDIWQTSNFQYTLRGLLVSGRYQDTSFQVHGGKWNRDDIELHRLQANFNANVRDYMQNFSIIADLPPEEGSLAGNATARVWISETNARARVRGILENPVYEPLYFTETLRFADQISLRHYMVYDPEKSSWTILTTSLVWGGLSASFTATRSLGYFLITREDWNDPGSGYQTVYPGGFGWYQDTEEKLNPQELSIAYQRTQSFNEGGIVNFEGSVHTGISFDLQRYTYSKFFFTLSLGAAINRFLDVNFRSHSENAVVFRYFQNTPLFSGQNIDVPGEKNILADLLNSFRFDDSSKRESSGFKLKSFGLDLVHHLGDWDATLGISMAPEFVLSTRSYRFFNQISFLIQWRPIKEFKTDFKYNTNDGFTYE